MVVILVSLEVPLALLIEHERMAAFRARIAGEAGVLTGQIADPVGRYAGVVVEEPHPGQDLRTSVKAMAAATGARVVVVDLRGQVLVDTAGRLADGVTIEGNSKLDGVLAGTAAPGLRSVVDTHGVLSIVLPVLEAGQVVGAVLVYASLGHERARVSLIWLALGAAGIGVLAAGIAIAWLLAGWLAHPLERLERAARALGTGDLAVRAPDQGPREIVSLAGSFNSMADELDAMMHAQRDFAANASHQLRTPLTGLRLRLEAIGKDGVDAVGEARLAMNDVQRLNRLMTDLLELARAAAPARRGTPVDLGELARTVVERWTETTVRTGRTIALVEGDPATVICDPEELEQVLDNLIDNAVRYSPEGGRIEVRAEGCRLAVADDGPGIPADEQARVFERFYRGTRGRRSGSGTGLGLSIAAELARRWRATLVLVPGPRTCFEIHFPEASSAPSSTDVRDERPRT